MLLSRRRRRYGAYAVSASPVPSTHRRAPAIIFAIIIVLGVWLFLRTFSSGGDMHRVATLLTVDGRGRVDVVMQGEDGSQRAESGLKLYEDDTVRTDSVTYASLHFFDGTEITLDRGSSLRLESVLQGAESSIIEIILDEGTMFIDSGTGTTVARTVTTALASHAITPETQAIIGAGIGEASDASEFLAVLASTMQGIGTTVHIGRTATELVTGEGQQLQFSVSSLASLAATNADPYSLRSILDAKTSESEFAIYVRERGSLPAVTEGSSSSPQQVPEVVTVDGAELVVDEPKDGELLAAETVMLKGRVGSRVAVVRVNGYVAEIADGAFQKEIALPAEEEFSIEVQAEDKDGLIIGTKNIALRRDIKPPEPPSITAPAVVTIADMENPLTPVSVSANEFEITGIASDDAVGIIVNGYRLQKYQPGKPWAYLVNGDLGNIQVGENTFEVVAVDRSGNISAPVKIIILWRAEAAPAIPDTEEVSNDTATYLAKGSLKVIAPTLDASPHVTSESEVLIEGETHPDTASISINGYRLSLYLPGKVTWNYIAKMEYGNFKQGTNRYVVVSRNSEGKILDVLRYVIEKK